LRIAIIGAGISGLATAFYLQRHRPDAELIVFDAAARPGGALETVDIDGFRFEAAANGFLSNKPEFLELVDDSGARDILMPSSDLARKRYIYTDGLHRLPESPGAFLGTPLLSSAQKLRVLGELLVPARRDANDESLREFGDRRLGRGFTNVFLDAMCAGIYGTTPEKVSVRAAFPLVAALEREHGGLFRGMLAKRRSSAGPGGRLMSFRRGVGAFTEHLAGRIDAEWRLGEPVVAIMRSGDAYRVVTEQRDTEIDRIVLAAPSHAAAGMLRSLDPELATMVGEIAYSPIAVVGFGYRGDVHPLDGFGLLTTSASQVPVLGILWDSSIFPDRAPAGARSVRVMIGGQRRPDLVHQDRAGLIATAREGLAMTMGLEREPDVVFVKRWDRGIPSYAPGHLERVDAIMQRAGRWPGLYLNGNAYRGVAMTDCARNSQRVARELVAAGTA
jgi:oxygen-dependent protoporphyrinogen oxidase